MGILVENNEDKSLLQDKIAADLRERTERTSQQDDQDVDFVEDSRHIEGTHKTARFSWFWLILIVLAILSLVVIFVLK